MAIAARSGVAGRLEVASVSTGAAIGGTAAGSTGAAIGGVADIEPSVERSQRDVSSSALTVLGAAGVGVKPAACAAARTESVLDQSTFRVLSGRRAIIAASGSPFRRRSRTAWITSASLAVAKSALASSPPLRSTKREFASSALRLLVTMSVAPVGSVVASTFTTCMPLDASQKLYLPSPSVMAEVPSSR